MSLMRRFWFRFENTGNLPAGVRMGCGVTAWSREDAEALLRQRVFAGARIPTPQIVIEDVDVSTLDPGHVRPNMGDPVLRGVWFPLGN
jgi:hypothetical protein